MIELPQIKISLDHMRYEIVHAFNSRADNLKVEVDKALDEAIKRFDFKGEIQQMATGILRKQIELSLQHAFRGIEWDRAIRKALVQKIMTELSKSDPENP